MAEINNLHQNDPEEEMENLENLSPKELQERIQEEKKNARRSLRLAFTALLAIIAVCIAWFASNNQVTVKDIQTSVRDEEPFDIASTGDRQTGERDYFKDDNGNILSAGTEKIYGNYIDVESGKTEPTGEKFYVGGSGIAWHMNGDQSLVPGAGGKLEFYIIPKQTGLTSVTIKLNMEGYALNEGTQKLEKLEDTKIQNLLNGHILLFRYQDDQYGYHGWLGADHRIIINAPTRDNGETTFVPNIPYKVTLYWKWPQYFRNYIYTQRSTYGDLFTDEMVTKYGAEYSSLVQFVNGQRTISGENGKLFYDASGNATTISDTINKDMSDTTLDACTTYYNQADEYIGTNTQYVYIQLKIE